MPLSELKLKISYRTGRDDIVNDFYIPCLKRSTLYQRAVGYFTSSGLAVAASGIAHLIQRDGRIQLIASPELTIDDIQAIEKGVESQNDVLKRAAQRGFSSIEDLLVKDRLEALAWMVANSVLEVKLAVRINRFGRISRGIYHEKMGIFSDSKGNQVAFTGSGNETSSALIDNFESHEVSWSWDDPQQRACEKVTIFNELWSNAANGLSIVDFTDATAAILRPYSPTNRPAPISDTETCIPSNSSTQESKSLPSWLELRDYQKLAIKNWFDNNGLGSLKMATGSGKTITALSILTYLCQEANLKASIVLCPYKHLVDQWADEAKKFNFAPLVVHTSRSLWADDLNRELVMLQNNKIQHLLILTTNDSFADDYFQSKIPHLPKSTILIADEAHNMGAKNLRLRLPEFIRWRLALSATPERWFDDEGTEALFEYFGKVLEPEFTLKDALDNGALAKYKYYPILVSLTDDEEDRYLKISEKISRLISRSGFDPENKSLSNLLVKRARLLASAENKLPSLRELMSDKKDTKHWLFYCGDGRVEDPCDEVEKRQIEAVSEILGHELRMKVASFVAETPRERRTEIISKLDSGDLQGLVAIRCLDEGVDIPSTEKAVILASSTNPRQFIQRRGRVLRKPTKNSKKIAEIYDMITIPPADSVVKESERSMLRRELTRFAEFASLALNSGESRGVILDLQKKYDLMDI